MKISLTTEYGIHSLIFLATQPRDRYTLLEDIAAAFPFSRTYLQKVCQTLARKGVLIAHRGVQGGYLLARPPESVTLREIVEVLEDTSGIYRCLAYKRQCDFQGDCTISTIFQEIEDTIYASLEKITLADLVRNTRKQIAQMKKTAKPSRTARSRKAG